MVTLTLWSMEGPRLIGLGQGVLKGEKKECTGLFKQYPMGGRDLTLILGSSMTVRSVRRRGRLFLSSFLIHEYAGKRSHKHRLKEIRGNANRPEFTRSADALGTIKAVLFRVIFQKKEAKE